MPTPHSSKCHRRTQVCPPARISQAPCKGRKQALPPPPRSPALLSFHGITCPNHSWGESRASIDNRLLHPGPDQTSPRAAGEEQGLCRAWPEAEEEEEELGRDMLGPPRPGAEQKAAQRLQLLPGRQAGRRKQVHWNGFLLPPQLERAWVSSPNGRPCWRPPFPGDTHCPSAGHSAICPAIVVHGPRVSTWCGGPEWDGVGTQLDQETSTSQAPPPPAHIPPPWCQSYGRGRAVLGHREIPMLRGTSQAPATPPRQASPHSANC